MNKRQNLGHRAQRTGYWAESKCTNLCAFDPYDSAIDKAYFEKYWDELSAKSDKIIIRQEKTHPLFFMPITRTDVTETLSRIPTEFLKGLRGVLLLEGSGKQLKVANSRLFRYGTYWRSTIFITPYPKAHIKSRYKHLPPPHIKREYERAGATFEHKGNYWIKTFSPTALKTFYLKDVLVHEVGHHVVRHTVKKHQREENFADWFAMEYGHKWDRETP